MPLTVEENYRERIRIADKRYTTDTKSHNSGGSSSRININKNSTINNSNNNNSISSSHINSKNSIIIIK
jgi:hypothetical protein